MIDVVITDTIPAGASYVTGGTKEGDVVSWTVPSLVRDEVVQKSFVVTAMQTIVNDDYGVRAYGDYGAGGSLAVPTVISVTVPDTGGVVMPTAGVTVTVGSSTFTETVSLAYVPQPITPTGMLSNAGIFYHLYATYQSNGQPAQPQSGQRYTITITYRQEDIPAGVHEADLALYYWTGSNWIKEPTSMVDVEANTITAIPDHFSLWAALVPSDKKVFLPVILKE
jgi:hypothetical protein